MELMKLSICIPWTDSTTTLWRFITVPSKSTGKTILKIKVNKKDVVISFTDREKMRLSLEVLANFYLYEGKTLSNKEISSMKRLSERAGLLKYAMSLLSKGHYSEWKMREKLYKKEASKQDVDEVIRILKNNDLINDKMLALDLLEYGNERNIGKNKIIQELSNKGLFDEVINKCKFPESLEKKKALNNLPKLERRYVKYPYEQKRQHIYKALLSLGFDHDIAMETLNKMSGMKVKDEQNKLERDFDKVLAILSRKYEGYELKNKVITSLLSKGYKMKDILNIWESKYGENDF